MEDYKHIAAQREMLQKKYDSARSNLLLAMILTVVNIVMLLAENGYMLLFSISVPYYVAVFGYLMGMLEGSIVIAAVILVVYFLCWLLSKNKSGWLLAAAILFTVDTLALAALYVLAEDFSGILDAVIHIIVLYYLYAGVGAGKKLKLLPAVPIQEETEELLRHSEPLRWAQEDVKFRVFLEEEYNGHRVCYRRVKRVNELVIDGKVYDEYEALMELPHTLSARIDGHTYEVGYNQQSRVFFSVDGQKIKSKMRWV